jgi:hypothetical protein
MSDKYAGDCDITVNTMMVSQEQRVGHASPRVTMLSYQFGWLQLLPHPSELQCYWAVQHVLSMPANY